MAGAELDIHPKVKLTPNILQLYTVNSNHPNSPQGVNRPSDYGREIKRTKISITG